MSPIYKADATWDDLVRLVGGGGNALLDTTENVNRFYLKWISLAGSSTDAQIASIFTTRGRNTSEAEVADMRLAFERLNEVYDFIRNGASPVQGDRQNDLMKFI